MAYFACPKAALTGTDQRTRISIAKGLASPTFTDFSGNQVLRGVVQADVVTGRNTGYATGQSIAERLASAGRRITSGTGGTMVYANQARRSVSSGEGATSVPAQLYQGGEGSIQTTNTLGLSTKMIVGIIAGVIIIGAVVMR